MKREPSKDSLLNLLLPLALILGLVLILSLNVGESRSESALISPLETWLKILVGYLAAGTEIAAAIVIGGAVIPGITSYLRMLFARSKQHFDATEGIRLQLGGSALGGFADLKQLPWTSTGIRARIYCCQRYFTDSSSTYSPRYIEFGSDRSTANVTKLFLGARDSARGTTPFAGARA